MSQLLTETRVRRSLRDDRSAPSLIEASIVIGFLFLNQFGSPQEWFTVFTGLGTRSGSNPILVGGSLVLMLALVPVLVGRTDRVAQALERNLFLVAFLFMIGFSFMWSTVPITTITAAVNLFVLSAFGVLMAVRFTLRQFLGMFIIVLAIGTLMSVAWVFALPQYGTNATGWSGLAVGKNDLGNDGVVGVLSFALGARVFPRWRFQLYALLGLALMLLVGSQSKTSLAAGGLTVAAIVVFQAFRARRTLYGAVVVTLLTVTFVAFLFVTANIGLIAGFLEKDVTLSGRTNMWPLILDKIIERPFGGYGYGGFWNGYFSPSFRVLVENTWFPNHAHNALLEISLDVGIVGVLLFLALHVQAVRRGIRYVQSHGGPLGLFPLAYLTLGVLVSTTESGLIEQRAGWTLFVAVLVYLSQAEAEPGRPVAGTG